MTGITVRGTAIARTPPDEATIELGVESLAGAPADALDAASERMRELVALCDGLGIAPERRVTAGATVEEHVEYVDGSPQHRGYLARSRLLVRLEEASIAGTLLAEGVSRASARVNGPWWSVAPDNPARLEACREAARDARRKAEAYAEALGARLGAIVEVREPGTRPPVTPLPRTEMVAMRAAASPVAEAPLEAGELEVTATVDVEFALEQG
jgi:uncharacterized protein YggE